MADLNETQKVARQASQLQNAERKADSMLGRGKAMGEAIAMDRVEGTQAEMMPEKEPDVSPRQALPQTTAGVEKPRNMSESEEFLTRDRPQLAIPDMSGEDLLAARQRLMRAKDEVDPGPQKTAFIVLLNRIESALEQSEGPK
ncbi:MAG: hypothetical protein Unbinned80contig1000_21 [Prokaryotic dsDNA virus sp.]|nr:MAG: hypothetical protein Unbinned80contig1000_21 [Prokaryotic dsDNA virus sp.]|tara:strand:- start:11638 stop:12066 length:429 start_codon:yes stop_codon:yes gene_type:complete